MALSGGRLTSTKHPIRAKIIETALRGYSSRWLRANTEVVAAIARSLDKFTESHSLSGHPPFSIQAVVEEEFDAVFATFLAAELIHKNKQLVISKLLNLSLEQSDLALVSLVRFARGAGAIPDVTLEVLLGLTPPNAEPTTSDTSRTEFIETIDAVRDFVHVCAAYEPHMREVIRVKEGMVTLGRTAARGTAGAQLHHQQAHYAFFLRDRNQCELCAFPTARQEALGEIAKAELTGFNGHQNARTLLAAARDGFTSLKDYLTKENRPKFAAKITQQFKASRATQGVPNFFTAVDPAGASDKYCLLHSDPATRKRAQGRRAAYYALTALALQGQRLLRAPLQDVADLRLRASQVASNEHGMPCSDTDWSDEQFDQLVKTANAYFAQSNPDRQSPESQQTAVDGLRNLLGYPLCRLRTSTACPMKSDGSTPAAWDYRQPLKSCEQHCSSGCIGLCDRCRPECRTVIKLALNKQRIENEMRIK